jgi:hypothetical protein
MKWKGDETSMVGRRSLAADRGESMLQEAKSGGDDGR